MVPSERSSLNMHMHNITYIIYTAPIFVLVVVVVRDRKTARNFTVYFARACVYDGWRMRMTTLCLSSAQTGASVCTVYKCNCVLCCQCGRALLVSISHQVIQKWLSRFAARAHASPQQTFKPSWCICVRRLLFACKPTETKKTPGYYFSLRTATA